MKRLFAVKKLRDSKEVAFKNEAYVLGRHNRIAKGNKSNHLAVLSATFEIATRPNPTFYFLFPCADCNLKDFWKMHSKDSDRLPKISNWVALQLRGLAEGLNTLHNFSFVRSDSDSGPRNRAIHGDIKPENILFFRNWDGYDNPYGILQLADFGLTKYHYTRTVNNATPLVEAHSYCSPEADLMWKGGQPIDIWSLGCLFLEFCVWLVFGIDGVNEFKKARKYESIQHANYFSTTFYHVRSASAFSLGYGVDVQINGGVFKVTPGQRSALN